MGEYSINIHAENILIPILNIIFNCDLSNMNYEESKTYASIDLKDSKKKIGIQITSTATLVKVKKTLALYKKHKFYKDLDELYIFIITQKQSSYSQQKIDELLDGHYSFDVKNIIDKTDIYTLLNSINDIAKINRVLEILELQFADQIIKNKWDIYCKGLFEYDSYICNRYKFIDIRGFSPKINNRQVKIGLENIYVPLKLSNYIGQLKGTSNTKKELINVRDIIEKHTSSIILGDPGSGKSTILKYIAYYICSKRNSEIFFNLVPIY